MSRESRLRLKLKSALEDIDRMEKGNYSQLLLRKKEEAFDLIIDLKNAWGISLEEIREDETYQTPRQLYDKLCAVKVREDRNDLASTSPSSLMTTKKQASRRRTEEPIPSPLRLRLRLVTSQGSPYPSRSPRAHPSYSMLHAAS